jgi:hypothetical protein
MQITSYRQALRGKARDHRICVAAPIILCRCPKDIGEVLLILADCTMCIPRGLHILNGNFILSAAFNKTKAE